MLNRKRCSWRRFITREWRCAYMHVLQAPALLCAVCTDSRSQQPTLPGVITRSSIVKVFGVGFDSTDSGRAVKPESMFMCAEVRAAVLTEGNIV